MHIYVMGIAGTFMGSLALLAKELGHRVSGVDEKVYPPMSDQLARADIDFYQGYENHHIDELQPDVVVVGNALSRGNPAVEYVLDSGIAYSSGPQWLAEHVLSGRKVLAVSGTHGKTTTASMLAWILESEGMQPGFLIGGVPENFGLSARLGSGDCFVIEADEYDCAFFDKRSKFLHYHPNILVINNLEFDHADIFADLAAIQKQFHHLVRTVPGSGTLLLPDEPALREVIEQGLWSNLEWLTGPQSPWRAKLLAQDQSRFSLRHEVQNQAVEIRWELCGEHNIANAKAAIAAARCVGVNIEQAGAALHTFCSVKRRQELIASVNGVRVYDDFAHHPSAIKITLAGLRAKFPDQRILAVIEPRSNTMQMGVHDTAMASAVSDASQLWWYQPGITGDDSATLFGNDARVTIAEKTDTIVEQVTGIAAAGDVIVIMSNGGFEGIHQKIIDALASANTVH